MVDLGNNEVDTANRRDLADELRVAVIGHALPDDEPEDYDEAEPEAEP